MRRLQRFTNYLLYRSWLAAVLVFVTTFIPVFGIVGILYAGLVTLRKGVIEGGVLTLLATLPYVISFYLSGSSDANMLPVLWATVGVAVLSNLLMFTFAVMLRQHTDWSQILQVAALVGVLVVSVIHLIYPNVADWWSGQLQSYYHHASVLTGMLKSGVTPTHGPSAMQMESINITKQYATGLMTLAVLFNALLQLIVARWWQSLVFSSGLLRKELHEIRLSPLAGVLFVFSLVLSYLGNSVVLDIMPVIYMLFGVAGLSLLHYTFALMKSPTRWFWIWLMYVTLIFALPTSIMFVALMGLLDIWLDIRRRLKKG